MKRLTILFILFLLTITGFSQIPYNERYSSSVFDEIEINQDIIYGNAPALSFPYLNENNTAPQDLLMDIYLPVGDTLYYRPALVCIHSGAFVSGTKIAEDMVAFCDSMAHRGYVTASIDYRLGMNILSAESSTRAVYRGFQDGRAAIRYLKENALYYGIDTNNIYMLGSSAGAYVGLHNLYMDTEEERPSETYIVPDLGCLDCSGNNFNHSGRSNGLVGLWGALQDTTLIIQSDTTPVFLAHGTADATVPFGYGSAFGNPAFPATYGSSLIADQIESFSNDIEKYFVDGEGHEFYGTNNGDWPGNPNNYWDTVFYKTENFIYDIHKPVAGFELVQMENMAIITDTSSMATSWYWDFGDGSYSVEKNPTHEYQQPGIFNIIQFVSNELYSWDTASAYAHSYVGVKEVNNVVFNYFPNPASSYITFVNNGSSRINVSILNPLGKTIARVDLKELSQKIYDIEYYSKGIYFLVISAEHETKVMKLIVN